MKAEKKANALYLFTPGFAADEADTSCIPTLQQFCLAYQKINPALPLIIFAFQYPPRNSDYQWNGIRVIAFGGKDRKGIFRIMLWLKIIFKFISMNREVAAVGIFSIWLTECALLAKWLSRLYSTKNYTWIMGQDAKKTNPYVKLIKPKEQELLAISSFIQRHMHNSFNLNVATVLPNAISPELFEPLNTGERPIDIIGVGSLIPLKQFNRFIEIIAEVNNSVNLKRVVIAGGGPEYERLQSLILEKKLENLVELTNSIPHHEVLSLMNQSKVLLHTSSYEGNPTVVHEALYSGCKVVSTCAIDPEQVKNFYCISDVEKIAPQLITMLSVKDALYKRVNTFSMEQVAVMFVDLFAKRVICTG